MIDSDFEVFVRFGEVKTEEGGIGEVVLDARFEIRRARESLASKCKVTDAILYCS